MHCVVRAQQERKVKYLDGVTFVLNELTENSHFHNTLKSISSSLVVCTHSVSYSS